MTCPYESGVRGLPQCLFFSTNKFKNLKDFIDNKSIGNQRFHPIPELGCISVDREAGSINVNANSCIKCGLCIFNCPGNSIDIVDSKLSSVCGSSLSNSVAWKSKLRSTFVNYSPKPLHSKNKIYKSFENFTSVKETDNISIWAANIFDYFCDSDGRVGLEIPLSIKGRDRDGRLDICFFKNDFLLIVEAKVTLKKMMEEGRYLPQLISYQEELDLLGKSINNIKLNKLLLIGGDDTDLLPDSHPDCTSFSGDLSKIFYKSIVTNNIRFITARGLLSLSMRAITDMKFDLVHFLQEFYSDKEAVGVVADHVIFKDKSHKLISEFI